MKSLLIFYITVPSLYGLASTFRILTHTAWLVQHKIAATRGRVSRKMAVTLYLLSHSEAPFAVVAAVAKATFF